MKKRLEGFYWVHDQHEGWIVARWDAENRRWEHAGYAGFSDDTYFLEIDENRLTR